MNKAQSNSVSSAEDALLRSIILNPNHVLSGLIPATATWNYNLRPCPTATCYLKRTIATMFPEPCI